MAKKNLFITYVLWFFFGGIGIHHFYLGRDNHAFVWWSTWGGFFYLGWLRDFWRIPEYVDEANEELSHTTRLKIQMKLRKEPAFNSTRFTGELFTGVFYGILVRLALPDVIINIFPLTCLLVCLGITTGVYFVGNIGQEKGPFLSCYITSVVCYIVLSFLSHDEPSYMYCSIAASVCFNYYRQYKPKVKKSGYCSRLTQLSCKGVIVITLWCSFFYFNASITLQDGETIYLRDSINHFFKSPVWLDFKNTMWDHYENTNEKDWSEWWNKFILSLDPTGENNAYNILGIHQDATEAQIRKAYKKLVVLWHPDRYKGDHPEEAQRHFMEIQEAYELLNHRRKKFNFQSVNERTEF